MKQRFAVNLFFLLFANLLIKPFWILGIDRVVQIRVGHEMYGTYFAVFNYSFIFSVILDFGINNFNSRAVSRNKARLGEYLFNLLILKSGLSVIYIVITFVSALFTGFSSLQVKMLIVLMVNQVVLSAILYLRTNIAALQLFKTDAVISVLDRLLTIIFCIVLLYSAAFRDNFDIIYFIYAQTFSLVITALVALIIIMAKTRIKFSVWQFKFTKKILLKSLPFAFIALTMGIYYRIDGIMIDRMLPNGNEEAGIYAASYRILDAVNMFGYLFSVILLPLFSHMVKQKESVRDIFQFSMRLMYIIAILVAAPCFIFSSQIINLLYHVNDIYWAKIFSWLMISFIPISLVYIYGSLLLARGVLMSINIITLIGAVINVVLNLFLIPSSGAFGATIATLITQVFIIVSFGVLVYRNFGLGIGLKQLMALIVLTAVAFGSAFILNSYGINWIGAVAISGSLSVITALVLKLVTIKDIVLLQGVAKNKS